MEKERKNGLVPLRIGILCILTVLCAVIFYAPVHVNAAGNGEMNIYGICLSSTRDGDATLVENNGKFLLMDMGMAEDKSKIISILKEQGAERITLYISHYHADHYGGSEEGVATGIENLNAAGIYVEKLYLPDPTLASATKESDTKKCERLTAAVENQTIGDGNASVVQLKKGSKFQFEDISAEVIGPIKGLTMAKCDNLVATYQNNHSLVTMMTYGKIKFFTAGDIHEEQEKLLVSAYGTKLKADIMKMSHHGTSTANSEEILKCIQPTYAYGMNTNHTSITSSNHQETFASKERVSRYGIFYMTGEEKKTIRIRVSNNQVSLYRYNAGISSKMKGWVTLKGGDGVYYKTDKYYLDAESHPLTGLQKIDGKYYYFGNGGCMKTGNYSATGVYNPWTAFGNKTRYIYKDGHMEMGFSSMKGRLYYFDKNGYKLNTNKSVELKKIEGKYYALIKGGVIYTNNGKGGFRKFPKGHRYFDANGVMKTGWKIYKGDKYYLDKETGYRVTGFNKINGVTYYFNNGGVCKRVIDTSVVSGFKGSAGKKSISLMWNKNTNVNGYEIYISNKKKGTYKRVATITSRSMTKYTIEKLTSKRTYYVKMRTYTIANGETTKGDFGKVIEVKVK